MSVSQNYADFFEVKSATRHATFDENVKQDLPFWISLLKQFIDADFPLMLRRSVTYEIAVASLRGLGTLIGQEEDLRAYFAIISNLESPEELEDVGALLNYCIGAVLRNQVQLSIEEISSWRDQLLTKVEQKLHQARTPNQKCPLLEIRGYLALQVDPKTKIRPDWEGAINWWTHMINIAKAAPLFPLERFSDRLTKYTRFIGSCAGYDHLSQQTDVLLSQRPMLDGSTLTSKLFIFPLRMLISTLVFSKQREISLLPTAEFHKRLEDIFRDGLSMLATSFK